MPNALAAMERGDIDCYLRTVGEYQGLGRRKDTQGMIIGTIDLSTGGDGWAADQSIQSVCDLEGKNIAVEPNLPARLLMQEALKRECDLSIADINLTDIAAADAVGVFASPDVAAVGTYEPVLSLVVSTHQNRGAHIVVSSKDYEDLILDIIMAHTDELAAHPDKYVKFLRGIYRAIDYFYANQEESIPIIASFFSITPEEFEETLPNFRYTPYDEAVGFIGTAEAPGRAYEIFRDAMGLNLEFGSSDVELFPEDHITPEIIGQVEKDWQ
jgi:NitT/TauT family transport system substrate-binding protein